MHFSRTYDKRGKLELINQFSCRLELWKMLFKSLGWKIQCKPPATTGMAAQGDNSDLSSICNFPVPGSVEASQHHSLPLGARVTNTGNPCVTTHSRTTKMSPSHAGLSQNYPLLLNYLPHGPYYTERRKRKRFSHKRRRLQHQTSFCLELAISSTYMQ